VNAKIGVLGNGGTSISLARTFKKEGLDVVVFGRNEKGWEKKVGKFIHIDKWKDDILTINTLPFIKSGKNIIDISYHFGQISEDATGMLACQGWLAFKRWFKTDITLEKYIRITFLHKTAVENTALIKRLCKNEI
jgi:shikimate 5-dehydrogenase